MQGTYTSPERVERGGVLVAFEGETMTMAEAQRRGLIVADSASEQESEPEEKPKPVRKAK